LADLPARREPLDKLETLKRPLDRLRTYSLALVCFFIPLFIPLKPPERAEHLGEGGR